MREAIRSQSVPNEGGHPVAMSANQTAPPVLPVASWELFCERMAIHPIAIRPHSDRTQAAPSMLPVASWELFWKRMHEIRLEWPGTVASPVQVILSFDVLSSYTRTAGPPPPGVVGSTPPAA